MNNFFLGDSSFWIVRFVILFLVFWGVYVDTVSRKIPNLVSVVLVTMGYFFASFASIGGGIFSPVLPGSMGLKVALTSGSVALAFGLMLFALKLWGAGDAKLIVGLSVWLHWKELALLVLLVALFGGVLAVGRMIVKRNAKEVLTNIHLMTVSFVGGGKRLPFETVDRMPFSWAIASAWGALMFLKLFDYV